MRVLWELQQQREYHWDRGDFFYTSTTRPIRAMEEAAVHSYVFETDDWDPGENFHLYLNGYGTAQWTFNTWRGNTPASHFMYPGVYSGFLYRVQ